MFKKYRKKPVVIYASLWLGDYSEILSIGAFITSHFKRKVKLEEDKLKIYTLEGIMTADIGDWIIIGVNGEIYPCKDDIFKKIYEEVKEEL